MATPNVDFDALTQACEAGELDSFGASAQLGWTLDETLRAALLEAVEHTNFHRFFSYQGKTFELIHALRVITEAATNESGVAILEQVRSLRLGKEVAIAFRDDQQVHFSVRYAKNLPTRPSHLWPELGRWYKSLARNRGALETWAKTAEGVLHFPLAGRHQAEDDDALGEQLLAAVITEPDDEGHRLVYADWLVGRGDPQGELIQLCERQRSEGDASADERIATLRRDYGPRIAGEVAELASKYVLERGFVSRVQMSAPRFAKHGARLLAAHPIRELELKPVTPKSLARLGRADALTGLRSLHIGQIIGKTRPMPFDELFGSPHFDRLEGLSIWTWVSDGDPEAAFAGLRAPKLRFVHLYEVDSAARVLAGLARAKGVELQTLHVDGRHVIPGEVIVLPSLRRLHLDRVELDEQGLVALLGAHPELVGLSLRDVRGVDVSRVVEIALELPRVHPLRALELRTEGVRPKLVEAMKQRFEFDFYSVL